MSLDPQPRNGLVVVYCLEGCPVVVVFLKIRLKHKYWTYSRFVPPAEVIVVVSWCWTVMYQHLTRRPATWDWDSLSAWK